MDIAKRALELEEYVIDLRREFHQHPEKSREEKWTSARICEELQKMGVPYVMPAAGSYAVIGCIDSGPGRNIALRADIDALQMDEKADVPYKSQNPGCSHACGHDAHAAMLLGAARLLCESKDELHGTVYLCVQPAEEINEGAAEIIDYLLEKKVEQVISIHIWADVPANFMKLIDGPTMAGSNSFHTKVIGCGGHGSRPDRVHDPIKAACELVLKWASIPTNFYDVFSPCVIHTCMIQGGQVDNIFPDEVHMETGTRSFKTGGTDEIMKHIQKMADGVAVAHDVQVQLTEYIRQDPVINTPRLAEKGRGVVRQMEGLDLSPNLEPISASDNFYWFLQKIPGFYAFLGAGNKEVGANYPHHHSQFNIDESVLKKGVEFFTRYTLDALTE